MYNDRKQNGRKQARRDENGYFPNMGTGWLEFFFEWGIVVYVEMALKWNGISDVSFGDPWTPGQFMPFLLGLAYLLQACHQVGFYALVQSLGLEDEFRYTEQGNCCLALLVNWLTSLLVERRVER
jgi:hypothetical protein